MEVILGDEPIVAIGGKEAEVQILGCSDARRTVAPARGHGRGGQPARRGARRRCRPGGSRHRHHDPGRQERVGQDRSQRPVPVRQRQEVQALPRRDAPDLRDFSDQLAEARASASPTPPQYLKIEELRARRPAARDRGVPT